MGFFKLVVTLLMAQCYLIAADDSDHYVVIDAQLDDMSKNLDKELDDLKHLFYELEDELTDKYRELHRDNVEQTKNFNELERKYEDYEDECVYNRQDFVRELFLQGSSIDTSSRADAYQQESFYQFGGQQNRGALPHSPKHSYNKDNLHYGWEIVFRGVTGNSQSVYDAWQSTGSYKKFSHDCDKVYCYSCDHWRSYLIDRWEDLGISKVKLELFKDDERVAFMIFDGQDSDMFDWFHRDRLLSSTWDDNFTPTTLLFEFQEDPQRTFYVLYPDTAACDDENGYIAVIESEPATTPCNWEKSITYPIFWYTPGDGDIEWDTDDRHLADILLISIMYNTNVW